jgi:hypothetical protein
MRALGALSEAVPNTHLSALEALQRKKLVAAYGDVRRTIWHARTGGQLEEELLALHMYGDLPHDADARDGAVEVLVSAAQAGDAARLAAVLPESVDVRTMLTTGFRARQAAAIRVVKAQAARIAGEQVADTVGTLLGVAAGLWGAAAWWRPLPELDAVEAISAFGSRIPESVVDDIVALAEPALVQNTLCSNEIAVLLANTYVAVESRRGDISEAIVKMLCLPEPPDQIWRVLTRLGNMLDPIIIETLGALADSNSPNALNTLVEIGQIPTSAQVAARGAAASLLRMSADPSSMCGWAGNYLSTTAKLLSALFDADKLVDVTAEQMAAACTRLLGSRTYQQALVQPTEDNPYPRPAALETADDVADALPHEPDEIARLAAAGLGPLAERVAERLMQTVEQVEELATNRIDAIDGLRTLSRRLPPTQLVSIAERLLVISESPRYSELDQMDIENNVPLSRIKIDTGAQRLPAACLLGAVDAAQVATASAKEQLRDQIAALVGRILGVASRLLRHSNEQIRGYAARVVEVAANVDPEATAPFVIGMVMHHDDNVRAVGASLVSTDIGGTLTDLASEASPLVRVAVATKARVLADNLHEALRHDNDVRVRRAVESALAEDEFPQSG